jgi:hypothetical protein
MYGADNTSFYDDGWEDDNKGLRELPPGEEGLYSSHAGQDATVYQIMEGVRPGCVLYVSFLVYFCTLIYLNFRRRDFRIRDDRVQKVVDSWQRQMPSLVDAYLRYKSEGAVSSEAVEGGWEITVTGFDGMYQRSRI